QVEDLFVPGDPRLTRIQPVAEEQLKEVKETPMSRAITHEQRERKAEYNRRYRAKQRAAASAPKKNSNPKWAQVLGVARRIIALETQLGEAERELEALIG